MDRVSVADKKTDQVIDLLEELGKWRRQRKILNFLMCFFLFFFFGAILRGCYLKHSFDTACSPGQFESYREYGPHEWVVCSDGVGEHAWVVDLKKSGK